MTPRAASASHRDAGLVVSAGALCFGQLYVRQACIESFRSERIHLDYAPP